MAPPGCSLLCVQVLITLVAGTAIRSIAYDPASTYMAAVTCSGGLHVWEISSRTSVHAISGACPEVWPSMHDFWEQDLGALHVWEISTRTSVHAISGACPEVWPSMHDLWEPDLGDSDSGLGVRDVVIFGPRAGQWTTAARAGEPDMCCCLCLCCLNGASPAYWVEAS